MSLIIRGGFALLGPAIGMVSRQMSLSVALVSAGITLLVFAVAAAVFLLRSAPELFHDRPEATTATGE